MAAFNLRNPAAVLFPFVWLRKTTVAWHEVVCEDGDEPFPRAVDNAAADYACGVAPKPHAHGESLLAAGTAPLKGFVEIVSYARQITGVL